MNGKQILLVAVSVASVLTLTACGRSPTERSLASTQSKEEKFEIVEIIARPANEEGLDEMRPTFPTDVIDIAIKTAGRTAGADLSVKMIALAEGGAMGQRDLRLNAASAAAPNVRFEPAPKWKPGRYLFEVSLDGKLAGSQELEVFPEEMAGTTGS